MSSVRGELQYLDPGSTVLRRFTAPGASINTGSYESHTVPIGNCRPVQDMFRIDTQGFEIVRHSSAVVDFTDKAEVDAVYLPGGAAGEGTPPQGSAGLLHCSLGERSVVAHRRDAQLASRDPGSAGTSTAYCSSRSSGTTSSARSWLAASTTKAATPSSCARSQLGR